MGDTERRMVCLVRVLVLELDNINILRVVFHADLITEQKLR